MASFSTTTKPKQKKGDAYSYYGCPVDHEVCDHPNWVPTVTFSGAASRKPSYYGGLEVTGVVKIAQLSTSNTATTTWGRYDGVAGRPLANNHFYMEPDTDLFAIATAQAGAATTASLEGRLANNHFYMEPDTDLFAIAT